MVEWFLKTIGTDEKVLEHLDQARFALQHPAVLWVGLALLVPVAWYIYRRQRENLSTVPPTLRMALSVTRVLVLAILVVVLSGPYLKIDHKSERKPIVAICFDQSQSMNLPAGPFESDGELAQLAEAAGYDVPEGKVHAETRKALNRIARSELAESVVRAGAESLIDPLAKEYDVRYYSFARQLEPLAFDPKTSSPARPRDASGTSSSYVGEAIYAVMEEAAGHPVSGIVLLSDGQNTGGRSPAEATRAAADAGTPIFTVPIGSSERTQDVSVVDVYTSGQVSKGDTARVAVTLESHGFDKRPVKVELRDGEEVLDSKEIALIDTEQQQIELSFEAKQAGARYLTVHVPPLAEESEELRTNNTDMAFIRVSEERLRVLLVDGLPRWDFRFLKNAIRRDHGLAGRTSDDPEVVLEAEWKRLAAAQRAEALPRTAEELAEYHTVILGDASPELINPDFQRLLIDAVREKGVGLIVAAGPVSMPHRFDTPLNELLPVRLRQGASGMTSADYKPFRLEISPDGVLHEAMRLYDDPSRNQNIWASLPPYYWCAAVLRPAPAATVLAWNPSAEGRYGKLPLIAYHYAGEGKVMFVATDSTWLWRQYVGDRFFNKFWGQSIRFVARRETAEEGKKSWIEVRPVRAQPGEQAQIELMAFKSDGTPPGESRLQVNVLGSGTTKTVEVVADPAKKGRYTGTFTPEAAGEHRLRYQPSDGSTAAEAKIRVMVAPEEFRYPSVNRPALELLASSTGGKLVAPTELGQIPGELKGEPTLTQIHHEATIWDNWLTLLVLILVYSADVGLRRLMGLS